MSDGIQNILKYFPDLDDQQVQRFTALGDLYATWNEQINVISRKDMDHFYVRHVLHSLCIARWTAFSPGTKVLDLGTGGGFPGIPLAILWPDVHFHLLDARAKKIKVITDVIHQLDLLNVRASHGRVEEDKGQYDFVLSRAVAPLARLWDWSQPRISGRQQNAIKNGLVTLKGGDLHEEMSNVPLKVNMQLVKLSSYCDEEFFETKKLLYLSRT